MSFAPRSTPYWDFPRSCARSASARCATEISCLCQHHPCRNIFCADQRSSRSLQGRAGKLGAELHLGQSCRARRALPETHGGRAQPPGHSAAQLCRRPAQCRRRSALNEADHAQPHFQCHQIHAGGGQVIVSGQTRPSGEFVLRVKDTGVGIAPEALAIALTPFDGPPTMSTRRLAVPGSACR